MYPNTMNQISVTSFYFANGNTNRSFPRRIEFLDTGKQLSFSDGLRVLVQKGQEFIEIFTMTDGSATYRLKHTPQQHEWELLGSSDPAEAKK